VVTNSTQHQGTGRLSPTLRGISFNLFRCLSESHGLCFAAVSAVASGLLQVWRLQCVLALVRSRKGGAEHPNALVLSRWKCKVPCSSKLQIKHVTPQAAAAAIDAGFQLTVCAAEMCNVCIWQGSAPTHVTVFAGLWHLVLYCSPGPCLV